MKNRALLIAGVPPSSTPIVRSVGSYLEDVCLGEVGLLTMSDSRLRFVWDGLRSITRMPPRGICIFFGIQSLPLLSFASRLKRDLRIVYWALESYSSSDGSSLAFQLSRLEKYLPKDQIELVVPIEERAQFHGSDYRTVTVFPNVPPSGEPMRERPAPGSEEPVKLVFYGSLDPYRTFVLEVIRAVGESRGELRLDLFGSLPAPLEGIEMPIGVRWRDRVPHEQLLKELRTGGYHYSVVGYKPTSFNSKFCAPNKFYEALSLSLPVVGHSGNPTLVRLVGETQAGHVLDLGNLECHRICPTLREGYDERTRAAYSAYDKGMNFQAMASRAPFLAGDDHSVCPSGQGAGQ